MPASAAFAAEGDADAGAADYAYAFLRHFAAMPR